MKITAPYIAVKAFAGQNISLDIFEQNPWRRSVSILLTPIEAAVLVGALAPAVAHVTEFEQWLRSAKRKPE
jgi:hypothetical protein